MDRFLDSPTSLARNLVRYASGWTPSPRREALYEGPPAGRKHLEAAGLALAGFEGEEGGGKVLIVAPGGGEALSGRKDAVADFLKGGGRVLAVGLGQKEAQAFLPVPVTMKDAEHISAFFEPPPMRSLLAGIGPADVHNRDPRTIPLVSGGAEVLGDGVLAVAKDAPAIFCQLAPWEFEFSKNLRLKKTFRRTSFLLTRLLANLGAAGTTPLLERFHTPVDAAKPEKRWLAGFYLDVPEEWDDPYRFFRW